MICICDGRIVSTVNNPRGRNTHALLLDLLHGAGGQRPLQRRRGNPVLVHGDKQLPADVEGRIKHLEANRQSWGHEREVWVEVWMEVWMEVWTLIWCFGLTSANLI